LPLETTATRVGTPFPSAMLRGLPSNDAIGTRMLKSGDGPAEFMARELWRVASKFMPSNCSMRDLDEDEEGSLPQEMHRVASQVLMRPNTIFQDLAGNATRRRTSTSKVILGEIPHKLRRTHSDTRLREGLKRSASEAQLSELGLWQPVAGPRLMPKRVDGAFLEGEVDIIPVWQPKQSDRACLVPPLCRGTAQIEAGIDFLAWANKIVQDVAEDATTANFSVARVPGPPPMPLALTVEAIRPPCTPPPWQSFLPLSPAVGLVH